MTLKILHSAVIALILSLSLLFSSCSGFFDFIKDIDEDDDSPEFTEVSFSDDYRNAFGIYLTATDIYGNELSSKSSGASGNSDDSDLSLRAASPLIDISSSGGWYIPSAKELQELYSARAAVNASLAKCGTADSLSNNAFYWSSSQHYGRKDWAWTISFENGVALSGFKTAANSVRVVREF